jgi:phage replication O-like protein O
MANPQFEDGYTRIANEILIALSFMRLSPNEWRLLNCIIRQTYGWQKKEDWISQSQFTEKTGIIRQNVWRTIEGLKTKKMIVIGTDYNKHPRYGFQKNYELWKMPQKMRVLMLKEIKKERERRGDVIGTDYITISKEEKKKKESDQNRLQDVSELRYTKETVTKETVKKEEEEKAHALSSIIEKNPKTSEPEDTRPVFVQEQKNERLAYLHPKRSKKQHRMEIEKQRENFRQTGRFEG